MASTSLQSTLARVRDLLDRGRGRDAVPLLAPLLRSGTRDTLTRDDELAVRAALAEAWLLQDDLDQALVVLGRTPDTIRETVSAARLSALWCLHGRIAETRGDFSRAIAMHGRALKQAEASHDSRLIGQAHYELAQCYRQVGDAAIVREHITKGASALNAAGARRLLALVHSASGVLHAQAGRFDEAMNALRQAERLAAAAQATDVLAIVCGNQANVMMLEHRYDQALALVERGVSLHEAHGSGHGLAVALATLGQVCVRLGDLQRAESALHRALEVRSPILFRDTTGAVFDSLAQIHLIRGEYELAAEHLARASEAYGTYGQSSPWYEWSIRLLSARLAVRRGEPAEALARADEMIAAGAPGFDALQANLVAADALLAADRVEEAGERLATVAAAGLEPASAPATWGEYLRLRGRYNARTGSPADAYHDFAQSTTLLDMLGERYQGALSHLALGRLVGGAGARSAAERHLDEAAAVFRQLGAERDARETDQARTLLETTGTGETVMSPADADDAIVRRIVDAAALPDLLARETAVAMVDASAGQAAVLFVQTADGGVKIVSSAGTDQEGAQALAQEHLSGPAAGPRRHILAHQMLGRQPDGPLVAVVASPRPIGHLVARRLQMIASVARQGFALCAARDRSAHPPTAERDQSLEPLLPGFLASGAATGRLVEQIRRLQGNELTVLITGESGTGKELVARAIHAGSRRSAANYLPYNCTTTGRDLADSQLFGHRRGAFTGAVSDQQGLVRAAEGGTLFLDEIGDLPLDVQPKLLRFLEQSEIMPVGDTKPQRVDVRVIAATNADLEQRVAEGKFREDLYYRLSVIRIHVPPLRERREEIPHLTQFFLREASERLGKPDVQFSSNALDALATYWWHGNVRQLRNEVQRAVALAGAGDRLELAQLSHEITATHLPGGSSAPGPQGVARHAAIAGRTTLAEAVEQVEREMIQAALDQSRGNLSETARTLGLTRRGLYLKLRRFGFGVLDPV